MREALVNKELCFSLIGFTPFAEKFS